MWTLCHPTHPASQLGSNDGFHILGPKNFIDSERGSVRAVESLKCSFCPLQSEKLRFDFFPLSFQASVKSETPVFHLNNKFCCFKKKVKNHRSIRDREVYTRGNWSSINDLPQTNYWQIQDWNPEPRTQLSCLLTKYIWAVCYTGMGNGFRIKRPSFYSWLCLESAGWSGINNVISLWLSFCGCKKESMVLIIFMFLSGLYIWCKYRHPIP